MVTAKVENNTAIIRIHDTYLDAASENRMQQLSRIVSNHYKRKVSNSQQDTIITATDNEERQHLE